MSADLASLVSRLETVTTRLEKVAIGGGGAGDAGPSSEMVTDYGDFIAQYVDAFITATNKVNSNDVKKAASLVKSLAEEQKKFLGIVAQHAEPTQEVIAKLLQPSSDIMTEIGRIKDATFKDKEFSFYTAAINEGMTAFGWVMVKPLPAPYVKECGNGAEFYTNRILKEKQDKDWVSAWKGVFPALHDYVKKHHITGLNWDKNASIATLASASSVASCPSGAPAPPPPPGPPAASSASQGSAPDVSALLSDINQGLSVTSGLKKVTDDMKTHKNPKLRLQSAVPYKAPAATKPKPVAKPTAAAPKKTPVLALQGKKWIVEHHVDRKDLVIDQALMKHTVYIYKCEKCTIQIKNKVNQIILDGCKKTDVVFDTIVSSLEFVNCQSVKGQVTGSLPTCSIEKTDGCLVYLNKDSLDCQFITAKSSEMNISIPKGQDYVEYPIIEQFKTTWNGTTFVTEPSESAE
uniref:adenylyl cyclase-associated protein 2-like isoform X2 n=1 Tax=Styela clava TaxID=7725 RepID=UPI00193A9835|nr:adenylyl cyclase-associated protein 2-like isoform X2 [Styela clava]